MSSSSNLPIGNVTGVSLYPRPKGKWNVVYGQYGENKSLGTVDQVNIKTNVYIDRKALIRAGALFIRPEDGEKFVLSVVKEVYGQDMLIIQKEWIK